MDRATLAYRALALAARVVPPPVAHTLVGGAAAVAPRVTPDRRLVMERNLRRAGADDDPAGLRRSVRRAFAGYGRYWVESFRLPTLTPEQIDAGLSYVGYAHIRRSIEQGVGPIVVLPHLGGWEWAAFWLTQVAGHRVTAVVERLDPPELFDFFAEFRRSLGMNVVPLGPTAGREVIEGIRRGDVICLVTDRDLDGKGVAVEFFGETTTLPAGPATLAFRTGAPLLPSAIFFAPPGTSGHLAVVEEAIPVERHGSLREDIARVTQDVARRLELLVRAAPEQWHLMQPNWPSDHEALGSDADRRTGTVAPCASGSSAPTA
ncbi:MAG: phosphatidylinositol mannoside acyltransferase [Acidimicrobiia bacterium]|nr:phosphatidylinositol mannoside acyltransferase [Acidimicrobiia bacterium]